VITAVDGTPVTVEDDLRPTLADKAIGASVTLTVRKRGTTTTTDVPTTLGRNDQDDSHGYLGVAISTADEKVNLPFDIDLDSGEVIGPSAGLAWTLGVIDRLTPGDLTHGKKIAVTGTIAEDGSVGPIGGIAQKVVGAKNAGATMFLYPASTEKADVKRLRQLAGDDIVLRPVATIDDALKVLDPKGLGAA
jgi:PDZ domain-containing protein